jgi:hypothetical protein
VLGEGARGPGGGGATEVGAVVPGGAEVAPSRGGLGDDGSGPDRLEEGLGVDDLEVGDVRELRGMRNRCQYAAQRKEEYVRSNSYVCLTIITSYGYHSP